MVDYYDLQNSPGQDGPVTSCAEQTAQAHASSSVRSKATSGSKDGARTVNAWREQWRQLGLQAWSAENDSRRETQNPRSLSQEHLEELRSTLRKGDDDFRDWDRELWSGLAKVRKRIHVLARNMHFAPQQGDVRRMVQAAEHDLRIFAEQTRHEEDELAAAECSLQDTLESSLARFEGWCSQESSLKKPHDNMRKPARPPSCSRLPRADTGTNNEAKQLNSMHEQLDQLAADIVADGGSTGGWSFDDHDTFLRVFTKFKRKTGVEFIAEAQGLLTHKDHEDLVAHVSWMLRYEDRQLQKRQLVEKWRCMRTVASTKEVSAEPKQELTAAAAREEKLQRACSRERVQKELKESKERVEEWRKERNAETRAQQEKQRRISEEAKQHEVRERRRQTEQRHQAIAAMREQRAGDELLIGRGARGPGSLSTAAARPVSRDDKKRIAERNTALLQRRTAQVQAKHAQLEAKNFEPPLRASSVGAAYKHVDGRLEESTRLFVDRSRELHEEQSMISQSASKYGVVPGNFAHQGVVRTMRRSASWRPRFGA